MKFTTKSMRGTEKKEARGKIYEQEEMSSGVRTESKEERKKNDDEDRERERETRETKGMWSSPSLCLAAL